jgi:hypothetical protein
MRKIFNLWSLFGRKRSKYFFKGISSTKTKYDTELMEYFNFESFYINIILWVTSKMAKK